MSDNKFDGTVFIKYNPYTVETEVRFNSENEHGGDEPRKSSPFHKTTLKGKRLQEWINYLPEWLKETELHSKYSIIFHGTTLDWEDIHAAAKAAPDVIESCTHIKGSDAEDKLIEIRKIYEESMEFGLSAQNNFEERIETALERGCETFVIATMSAGKSTLINALLGERLMPSANTATTAIITRIIGEECSDEYDTHVFGEHSDTPIEFIKNVTYDDMERLNSQKDEKGLNVVSNIVIRRKIPFVEPKGMPFVIVDTPGTNSTNPQHGERTMKEIESGSQSLIIFVFDGTNTGVKSEKALLHHVANAMKNAGKMSRDRFLFVINKIDEYDNETQNIAGLLATIRDDLCDLGINDARIYPASTRVALSSIVGYANKKETGAAETMIEKYELHLERPIAGINSHIPDSERRKIDDELETARKNNDIQKQALIHSGIPTLEAAIREYIEKYAKAIRIGEVCSELTKSLCLEADRKLNDLKVMSEKDSEARERLKSDIANIEEQIGSGKSSKEFEVRLDEVIESSKDGVLKTIEEVKKNTSGEMTALAMQHKSGQVSLDEARRLSDEWKSKLRDNENKLKKELSDALNLGIKTSADRFLEEYRKSVEKLISKNELGELPFDPLALVSGDVDVSYDEFTVEEDKVVAVYRGKKKVKNPEREGWGYFLFFLPWEIEVDDIINEHHKETYVDWLAFANTVINRIEKNIAASCADAVKKTETNAKNIKKSFREKFGALNKKLDERLKDLTGLWEDDEKLKKRIDANKKQQLAVKALQKRIESILNI